MNGRRPTIFSLNGIVAAAHPLAAQAGARLLAQGGNAFDAAVATAAALNVVEPFMSGLAGLGLATCYVAAERRVRTLDFVPPVPARWPVERFGKREELRTGALAVSTPGNLAGWAELLRAYGTRALADTFEPAIALARDGFALAEFGVMEFNEHSDFMHSSPAGERLWAGWAETYTGGVGRVELGRIVRQPHLARTLETLASRGSGHLYGGALGEAIVAHLQELGGSLTLDDLRAVNPKWKEPLAAGYRGLLVNTLPPPCEAFQFLLTLRILEGLELGGLARQGPQHLDTVWRAIRLAAGERIADNNPSPARLAQVLSDASAERLRARLRNGEPIEGPTEQWIRSRAPADVGEHHTTSFSVADRHGNVVCITQSLGSPFGSSIVVPGMGLCLNNFLFWADVDPQSPNRSRRGASLPICMAPSISLRGGAPVLALGTPGSYGILQTQVQALVQYVDFGLGLQDAIEAPRARLWDGRLVEAEARIDPATLAELGRRGHDIKLAPAWSMRVGGMQGIAIDPATGVMSGAADPRRDGYVATP
jgi:gamma-glutamyltranspeptidase/glutathione hydrolase